MNLRERLFKRGHILNDEDLDHLRRLGKNHLYILKPESNELHEDEAGEAIATALCGSGVEWSGPIREGKVVIKASFDGLLKVDVEALNQFNMMGEVSVRDPSQQHHHVKRGKRLRRHGPSRF